MTKENLLQLEFSHDLSRANSVQAVATAEIREVLERDREFLSTVFTLHEQSYLDRPLTHELLVQEIAGRYGVKMGVVEILWPGIGVTGVEVPWQEIEIRNLKTGKPVLQLYGQALSVAQQRGFGEIGVSIAHLEDLAGAFVVASSESDQGITCGLDMIETARVARVLKSFSEKFLNHIFNPAEQERLDTSSVSQVAGGFASKEAVSKGLGTGLKLPCSRARKGVCWKEIGYFHADGDPKIEFYDTALIAATEQEIGQMAARVFHHDGLTYAFVVASKTSSG